MRAAAAAAVCACAAAAAPPAPSDVSIQPNDTLDAFIQDKIASVHIPSLSVVVQQNATLLWSKAFGYSNSFSTPPLNASVTGTPYTMASVSKTVMATTLLLLYDQGLFALDDDVNTYLSRYPKAGFEVRNPGYPNAAITFRQLLTHTSSVNDDKWANIPDKVLYTRGQNNPLSLRDLLYSYFSPKGKYFNAKGCFHKKKAPGEMYDYSNMGATLLGYMVEVLTGTDSFAQYSIANVLKPLGMDAGTNNWLLQPPLDPSTVALPSSWIKKKAKLEPYCLYGTADYPDGGFRATAAGLARHQAFFMQFGQLGGTRLLKEETVREMRRKQTPPGMAIDSDGQGLIWYYDRQKGRELLGHDGSDYGVSTQYFFNPKTNVGVVLLMNGDWDQVDGYADAVDAISNKLFDTFESLLGLDGETVPSNGNSRDPRKFTGRMQRSRSRRRRRRPGQKADLCDF